MISVRLRRRETTCFVRTSPDSTITQLKNTLFDALNSLPDPETAREPAHFFLRETHGKKLDDDALLSDVGIEDDALVYWCFENETVEVKNWE